MPAGPHFLRKNVIRKLNGFLGIFRIGGLFCMDTPVAFTVTQLNEYVKALVDSSEVLCNVCVVGEISNFNNHYKTGHLFFTLKDENALLKTVMFKTYASSLNFKPDNSMKVLVYGRISVFERDGIYQLYAVHMERFGVGELYIAFEKLKKKLSELGMFDEEHKKAIPKYPKRIGIITSPEAAAVADMKNIISRRYPLCEIHIYPALVQGKDAPKELCAGIDYFDRDPDCDVIIIGRGGGSIEDLWAFNDENLAKTIFACGTPVISAVGHETDFTICDFVSDLRAPTPSAAAELAVPDKAELYGMLKHLSARISSGMHSSLSEKKARLDALYARRSLSKPEYCIEARSELTARLDMRINAAVSAVIDRKRRDAALCASRLSALNPMAVLARGYGAVFDSAGGVVSSVKELKSGDGLNIMISDGSIHAKVESICENDTQSPKEEQKHGCKESSEL